MKLGLFKSTSIKYLTLPNETVLIVKDLRGRVYRLRLLRLAVSGKARLVEVLVAPNIRRGARKIMCVTQKGKQVIFPVDLAKWGIDSIGPNNLVYLYNPRADTALQSFHVQGVEVEERLTT